MPAQLDNPKGFWERIDVVNLHKSMLEKLGIDWHLISTLDIDSIDTELVDAFTQKAKQIMLGIDSHRPWVLKDPRLCLLLPLWLPLLEVPVCVHVARHPLSTAQSLVKRDGFPLHFGIALWEQYNAHALMVSSGFPRFSICYEQLIKYPVETVELLYTHLCHHGVMALRLPSEREIRTFLESELQHHRASDTQDAKWLTPDQSQLWEALRDSKLENIDCKILENSSRVVLLADYEALLRERSDLHQRDLQLAAIHEQLAVTESDLQRKEVLLKKSAADLQSLGRLFEALHHDTQLIFDSLTWQVGFTIAEAGRRLGLLRRTCMVQDHIAQIVQNYQSWLSRQQSVGSPPEEFFSEGHFNEDAYLTQYPDVQAAVKRGEFGSGREHFELRGREEIASGVRLYIPNFSFRDSAHAEILDPELARREIARWRQQPLISIIMPVYNVESRWLEAAIQSVTQQIYPRWELCIADDGSTRPETLAVLRQINDLRCKVNLLDRNQGIAGASNAALALATGDYIAFLDHDDELTPDALYHVVKAINEHDPDLVYSDEDKLSLEGYRLDPHFKPDYSPDLILSTNYICHFSVYRKALLDQIAEGGNYVREGFEGSQDHDLVLRVLDHTDQVYHIPRVLYHWRMIPGSTAARYDSKNHAWEAGRLAVEDTLQRRGIFGKALLGQHSGTYRVKRAIQGQPLVSILLPFRDQPDLLRLCLDSILEKTTYPNFELIGISNNSADSETLALMKHYAASDRRIRFLRHDVPFNYAAINNFAAAQVSGEHLLLLNNDIAVITPDWLETLLEHSQRLEVGAVGAKLHYLDDTVQHGGVIVGLGGIAGHAHKNFPCHHPGYFQRLNLVQNLSAVTAACLMVKRSLYTLVGGMDEQHLAVAFNDVDFCLRLRELGYLNVFTPYCRLYHYESKTRGYEDTPEKQQRFIQEVAYMRKRHATILKNGDPYYNLNLPLDRDDFGML